MELQILLDENVPKAEKGANMLPACEKKPII
jgi:hypothetical protein